MQAIEGEQEGRNAKVLRAALAAFADPTLAGSGKEVGTKLAGHTLLFEPYAMIPVTGPETAGTCLAPSELALSKQLMLVTSHSKP